MRQRLIGAFAVALIVMTAVASIAIARAQDATATLAFFTILERFPRWQATALRTTSALERLNRRLRRIFRLADAFHSLIGLNAAITRVLAPFIVT